MTLEPFRDKSHLSPLYTPTVFLDALRDIGWQPGVVPPTVIYTYPRFELYLSTQPALFTANDMLGTGPGRFFLVNDTDNRVGINCLGIGPSATAAQLGFQAALGVRHVLLIGTAGGLAVDQQPGDILVPTVAVRADGTSDHYAPPGEAAMPDAGMRAELAAFLDSSGIVFGEAPCWTTAAPFRTTADEVAYYAEHGVRAVEEEVAALFVVGSSLNIQTAAALVLDGVPSGDGSWRIDLAAAQQSLQRLFTASIDFAAKL